MNLSNRGLELIASFEGFSGHLYNDPAGHATIGFGHLVHLGPINSTEPLEFRRGITRARALELLRQDVARFEATVSRLVQVELSQPQFDALVSWAFNIGTTAMAGSDLLRRLNAGEYGAVPKELARWNRAGGKILPGLSRRRQAEALLWRSGTYKPAPTAAAPQPQGTLRQTASDLTWWIEETIRAAEAGDSQRVDQLLRSEAHPRAVQLREGIL